MRYSAQIVTSMHVPDQETSPKRVDISYVIIGLCLFSIYLLAGRELNTVDQTIVPRGDAFSYSTFLFEILNRSCESFGSALQYVVELGNFIWLQHFLVLAFAPLLANQRGSLIFINYFAFFLAIIIVFRTALLCRVPHFWAFAIALLFASMPWNFHALMQFNLTSLMPEPIFVDAFLAPFCCFAGSSQTHIQKERQSPPGLPLALPSGHAATHSCIWQCR